MIIGRDAISMTVQHKYRELRVNSISRRKNTNNTQHSSKTKHKNKMAVKVYIYYIITRYIVI